MKRLLPALALLLLTFRMLPGGEAAYRLEYLIRGSANSRVLLVFPIRVYYEASAAVDLLATPQENGSTGFAYAGLPRAGYILRTLGFSGKSVALLTVDRNDRDEQQADNLLTEWQKQAPEFAARVKTIKKFLHSLRETGPVPFAFERDASGFYRDFMVGLEPRYRYHPAKTGIYFNVFPILADLLKLFNHRFVPEGANWVAGPFPLEWPGDEIDFTADLNRVVGLIEKAVKSIVTVEQKFPFRLHFRLVSSDAEAIEICGEAFPDVPLWKGFMIREVHRRVRLRAGGQELLADEIRIDIRNSKGQGGFGRLLLEKIDPREDER